MSDEQAKMLAKSISRRLAQAITEDEGFWDLVDAEIVGQLKATEKDMDAQLWLDDGEMMVCVKVFECDNPLVVPVWVPAPSMPAKPEYDAQVDESRREIANLRKAAARLAEMADQAERELNRILNAKNAP